MTERPPTEPADLLRVSLSIPAGWEESLLWQLEAQGWGQALHEQAFPAGHLDDEPVGRPEEGQVVVVIDATRESEFQAALAHLAGVFAWREDEWSFSSEALVRRDWETAWREQWKPFRCAGFVVHADFHREQLGSVRESDQLLELPIGSAFGTGGHPSTRIALRALRRWSAQGRLAEVLDVGMGTGILAVAAAVLGSPRAWGMDPDPPAAAQADKMAAVNGVAEQCHFWQGTLESASGQWSMVFANLQSGLLQRYAHDLFARMSPGAVLFTGGFMDRNSEPTLAALREAGLELTRLHRHGRWRAAEWKRPM